jgi:hypothetical protein
MRQLIQSEFQNIPNGEKQTSWISSGVNFNIFKFVFTVLRLAVLLLCQGTKPTIFVFIETWQNHPRIILLPTQLGLGF